MGRDLAEQQRRYQWSLPGVGTPPSPYPPACNHIPFFSEDNKSILQIFDAMRLADTGFVLSGILPDTVVDFVYSNPDKGDTMEELDKRNAELRAAKKNILKEPNVGDCVKVKWFTDENFGQQQLIGANPVTITLASEKWVTEFTEAAEGQGNTRASGAIQGWHQAGELYVQDCSYYREAIGLPDIDVIAADVQDQTKGRYTGAAVTLFHLSQAGRLHPISIIIDYKQSIDNSVVIFNRRLSQDDGIDQESQAVDWPWRYAKSCAQSADWIRHEATVHLTHCHMVEEATIVASKRTLPRDHLVYRCLSPHWFKTLPLNAAARNVLVPSVIVPICGMSKESTYSFIRHAYSTFNWTEGYVPRDLERRGFPPDQLDEPKFHNYAYGRGIYLIWQVLRKFVKAFLVNGGKGFSTDEKVRQDQYIRAWCKEMQSDQGGQMKSWPTIQTLDELVDCVTMCIHIASPQHTAVNYLQEYFQSYVVNRPPALCTPPPTSLDALHAYTERDLMLSLPIGRPHEWLLASHLVHLLSYKVAEDQNIQNYGVSLFHSTAKEPHLQAAAKDFVNDLVELGSVVNKDGPASPGVLGQISSQLDFAEMPYTVMEPVDTAVSILI